MTQTEPTRYVVVPNLEVRQRGHDVCLTNPAAGTDVECSEGVLSALALLKQPTSLESIAARSGLSASAARAILAPLIDSLLVVPEEFANALTVGPTRANARAIGAFLPIARCVQDAAHDAFVIVGAPSDAGAGPEGLPSHGPHLIRGAFPDFFDRSTPLSPTQLKWGYRSPTLGAIQDVDLRRQYRGADLPHVYDVGDVIYEAGEGLDSFGSRLAFVTSRVAEAGMRPFVLGGDHSITRFSVGSLLRHHERIGIIHFDAHHDLYKGLPAARLCHANPFAHLIEEPRVELLHQVGLRAAFEQIESQDEPVHSKKLSYVSAFECQTAAPEEVFAGLPRDLPYYLSFDIDVMDPIYAPETGMPELGGLTYYQALRLVDYVARNHRLIGADLVEVGGSGGRTNGAARVAGRIVAQILLGDTPFEQLRTYLHRRSSGC